jgi:hypothetical protein
MTVSTHHSAGGAGVHISSTLLPNGRILSINFHFKGKGATETALYSLNF